MVSRSEAFLILKKWRDDETLLEWSEAVSSENPQGETTSMARGFWEVRVDKVSDDGVTLRFDGSSETRQLEIPEGSLFEYSDRREPRFPDLPPDEFVCFLEVVRPDGLLIILAERSEG